jgi:hypothetical protein
MSLRMALQQREIASMSSVSLLRVPARSSVRAAAKPSRLALLSHIELRAEPGRGFVRGAVLRAGVAAHCLARSRQAMRSATSAKQHQQRAAPSSEAASSFILLVALLAAANDFEANSNADACAARQRVRSSRQSPKRN